MLNRYIVFAVTVLMLSISTLAFASEEARIDVITKCKGYTIAVQGKPVWFRCWKATWPYYLPEPAGIWKFYHNMLTYQEPSHPNTYSITGLDPNCNYRMTGPVPILDIDLAEHKATKATVLSYHDTDARACRISVSYQ